MSQEENYEILISAVRKFPEIYDPRYPDYKNQNKRTYAWRWARWLVVRLGSEFACFFAMDKNNIASSPSLLCGEQQISPNLCFTRYFIVKRIDNNSNTSFKNTSPFLIVKTFHSILGDAHGIRKLQSGDLMVEVSSAKQSNILSACTVIGSFSVSVQKHPTLNICRGDL